MKLLYLEGASGISGDMTVAALLDLGASREKLDAVLESLHLEGYHCHVSQSQSYSIAGVHFDVHLHEHPHEHGHDHAHEHEHTHDHGHEHAHDHDHEHAHAHEHEHPHDHTHAHEYGHAHDHDHGHVHRNLHDVYEVIDRGTMTDRARALAKKIFRIVAEAEFKAHGLPIEEVHFHEVGAIDSIVDIVSAAVLVDDLGIAECVVTGLAEGTGFVTCQHGTLPVPVPAVLNIAEAHNIPLRTTDVNGEMVTPTGIAIAAALRTRTKLPPAWRILKTGIGIGTRDFGRPNLLRAMLIEDAETPTAPCAPATPDAPRLWVLETNIDDATGETLGHAMELLFAAGARDVCYIPCFMKKNRPAWMLWCLADEHLIPAMEEILFSHTETIGVRRYPVERSAMQRSATEISLPCGTVRAKRCAWGDTVRVYPEYESVKNLSAATGIDFRTLYNEARAAANPT